MNEKLFIWCFIAIITIPAVVVYATSCSVNVCQNGGTCSTSNTDCAGYTCTCVPSSGWYGFNCSLTCSTAGGKPGNRPCVTGSCNDGTGTCDCSGNNVGYQCESSAWCPTHNFCQNGASCISTQLGGGTQCNPYIFDQGYCGSSNGVGGFDCPGQFIGTYCNTTKFCVRNPTYCQNGGSCNNPDYHSIGTPFTGTAAHDSAGAIGSCTCPREWVGNQCQTLANPCTVGNPCLHGGICRTLLHNTTDYWCDCVSGWTGTNCTQTDCKNGIGGWRSTQGGEFKTFSMDPVSFEFGLTAGTAFGIDEVTGEQIYASRLATRGTRHLYAVGQYYLRSIPKYVIMRTLDVFRPDGIVQVGDASTALPTVPSCGGHIASFMTVLNIRSFHFLSNHAYILFRNQHVSAYAHCLMRVVLTENNQTFPTTNFTQTWDSVYVNGGNAALPGVDEQPATLEYAAVFLPAANATKELPVFYYFYYWKLYLVDGLTTNSRLLINMDNSTLPIHCRSRENIVRHQEIKWSSATTAYLITFCVDGAATPPSFIVETLIRLPQGELQVIRAIPAEIDSGINNGFYGFSTFINTTVNCDAFGGGCSERFTGQCECNDGWSGSTCSVNNNECSSNPCQNGGTCLDGNNQYRCICAAGYSGINCNVNINECASSPCKNGATCVDAVNSFACTCPAGYSGILCQTEINECVSNLCQHGNTCVDRVNGFTCLCIGYSGVLCQTDINECASNPCGPAAGGICTDAFNSYSCSCLAGSAGTSACIECPIGRYIGDDGQASCLGCPPLTHQNLTGQTTCVDNTADLPTTVTAETVIVVDQTKTTPAAISGTVLTFIVTGSIIGLISMVLIVYYCFFSPPLLPPLIPASGNTELFSSTSGPPFEHDPLIYNNIRDDRNKQ